MTIADADGIIVGIALNKKIPDKQIKWFAEFVFITSGLRRLIESLFNGLLKK